MLNDQDLVALRKDMGVFFEKARSDDAYIAELAKPYIVKWGEKFGWMATAWVAENIQQNWRLPDIVLVTMAMRNTAVEQSLIKAYGDKGLAILLSGVMSSSDEDCLALDAFLLASKDFANPKLRPFLETAFGAAIGTSCKMALAFALDQCGDSQELKQFVADGYFGDKEFIDFLRSGIKVTNPGKNSQEIERLLLDGVVAGMRTPFGTLRGVFAVLVMDIASRGRDFPERHPNLPWARKQYND